MDKKTYIETPVLFLTFNKKDTTPRVLNKILKCNPKKLIITSDGPRTKEDEDSIYFLRNFIDKKSEFFEIEKQFNEENLGLKQMVSSSITKYINKYKRLIIVEDDVLPSTKFFKFCDNMLDIYQNEQKINLISGFNYLGVYLNQNSHQFSRFTDIWGWATWDDRWNNKQALTAESLSEIKSKENIFQSEEEKKYFVSNFEKVINHDLDSWAFELVFSNFYDSKLSVLPNFNLTKNIGLGNKNSTHTKNKFKYFIQTLNIRLSIFQKTDLDSQQIYVDNKFNQKYLNRVIFKNTKYNSFVYKILKLFRKT
tara:strand:- start:9498 stop:10424 length:927 start_codon:yes stop_codon:yes gene_type:complete